MTALTRTRHGSAIVLALCLAIAPLRAEAQTARAKGDDETSSLDERPWSVWLQPVWLAYFGLVARPGPLLLLSGGAARAATSRVELVVELAIAHSVSTTSSVGAPYGGAWAAVGASVCLAACGPHEGLFVQPKLIGVYSTLALHGLPLPPRRDDEWAGGAGVDLGYARSFGRVMLAIVGGLTFGYAPGTAFFGSSPFNGGDRDLPAGFRPGANPHLLRIGLTF